MLLALALALSTSVALAKPGPCAPTGPWVLATVRSLPAGLDAASVLDRLGTELSTQGVTLCTQAPRAAHAAPAAEVDFSTQAPTARAVKLEVDARRGSATKQAQREVDLSVVPRDSRAAVVALAADELMRAAWDELALQPAPKQAAAPPSAGAPSGGAPDAGAVSASETRPEPRDGAARSQPPLAQPQLALGLRGAGEWWSGGLSLLGGDVALSMATWQRLRLELHLGARTALEDAGADGTVDARTFSARVGAVAPVLRRGLSPEISLAARLGAHAVQMSGTPRGTARGSDETGAAFTFEIGPSLGFALGGGGTMLVLDGGVAAALQGVAARDGDDVVTGLSGFAFTTSLGILAGVL
jgi:hypothetical protein